MAMLEIEGLSKSFPGVLALDGISLSVEAGEVHALLGENGAGKSTLLKILAGAQEQDAGTIRFRGSLLPAQSPLERQKQGIVTIYQEFNLLPAMSVADNIFIGREPVNGIFIDGKRMLSEAKKLLGQLKLSIAPTAQIRDLSVAEQQMVEIAKALSMSAEIIIMDEPTAALSEREVRELHLLIRELRTKGVAIIYVTHRLAEVFEVCDRFTVLRDGRFAGEGNVADTDMATLIRLMVGRNVEVVPVTIARQPAEPVLEVRQLSAAHAASAAHSGGLENLSITVRRGEIVGIAGLVGAGRTEFARAIFGADPHQSGMILIEGKEVEVRSPDDGIRAGMAFVPEDRKQHGLSLIHSVRDNFSLPNLAKFLRVGIFVSDAEEEKALQDYKSKLRIRMASSGVPVGTLSGGNQQKVILARCMALQPKVLIVDEPTRGIDVGSKAEVHQLLASMAESGVGVLVISSELPEVMSISHRIVTMREGHITGELSRAEATEERLMELMALPTDRVDHSSSVEGAVQ